MQLTGKTALITGAGDGIGRAMARGLAEDGANLALVDLDGDSLEQVKKEVESIDLTKPGALDRTVDETVKQLGSVDVLCNNAGITWHKDFFDEVEEVWGSHSPGQRPRGVLLHAARGETDGRSGQWRQHH